MYVHTMYIMYVYMYYMYVYALCTVHVHASTTWYTVHAHSWYISQLAVSVLEMDSAWLVDVFLAHASVSMSLYMYM